MNFLDVVVILIVVTAAVLETIRGFGRAVFDALAVFGVLWLASVAAGPIASHVAFAKDADTNVTVAYGIVAVAGFALALYIGHVCYTATLPHAGMFDSFFGLVLGVVVGAMFAHCLVRGIVMSDPNGDGVAVSVSAGVVSSEMYDFHTYHSFVDSLTDAANTHRDINLN